MKAKLYDKITTLTPINSDFNSVVIPKNTEGVIVECYENSEGYAVDIALPNVDLVGGFQYTNVILMPEQFQVISENGSRECYSILSQITGRASAQ
ncbi:MAG: hypothetical protein J7545_13445 [Roseofilum sp. SBFL]|uniref:hypothetical protein n=1 Tax=unclassified Roseofilum TaxID=2620099 RepID=UPI001B13C93B|nr:MULTISPECIES: hypothetical protein [unclassified Roseofilum]MBP0014430.1 hypothetical protein [Roseofilum sp. SID3]MBP0023801.1 hypothetical protein [Roseofilum sp. SID2]MBP0038682.1 hypothetical protein [Roseofilum sp. SID1]MBP0042955.1 hypothetical protein [Roseofilum sp. SBFL]